MISNILLSPPVAACIFLALAYGIYRLGGALSPPGEEHPGKCEPYACGEDLGQPESRLSYQRFFRLALVFVVVHMAALVVATLPLQFDARLLATVYLAGVGVCVDILVRGQA